MNKPLILASALLLSACATSSSSLPPLALTATPTVITQPWAHNKTITLTSENKAPYHYIAAIDSGTENVQIIQPAQPIVKTLRHALAKQLTSQGFTLRSDTSSTMNLIVEKALVTVKQDLIKFTMNSELQLELTVNTPKGQFIKRYSGHSTRKDALTASQHNIAMSMDKLMDSVLNEIANDRELNHYLMENI